MEILIKNTVHSCILGYFYKKIIPRRIFITSASISGQIHREKNGLKQSMTAESNFFSLTVRCLFAGHLLCAQLQKFSTRTVYATASTVRSGRGKMHYINLNCCKDLELSSPHLLTNSPNGFFICKSVDKAGIKRREGKHHKILFTLPILNALKCTFYY